MRRCTHLGPDERDGIAETHARHEGVSSIAREMGRDKSTVGRELVRNGRRGRCGAQGRAEVRRAACRPRRRLDDPALAAMVRSCILGDHWSPEQIEGVGRIALRLWGVTPSRSSPPRPRHRQNAMRILVRSLAARCSP